MGRGSAIVLMTMITITTLSVSMAHQYTVGDTKEWNLNVDLSSWISQYSFKVGDTLMFSYNAEMHNVLEVSETDYATCNIVDPMKTYDDGNTVVTLEKAAKYYFICGIPGHCTAGMKVEVDVKEGTTAAPPVMAPSVNPSTINPPPTSSHKPTPAPSPPNISSPPPNHLFPPSSPSTSESSSSPAPAPTVSTSIPSPSPAPAPTVSTSVPSPSPSSSIAPISSPPGSLQNFTSISPSTSIVMENPNLSTSPLVSLKLTTTFLLFAFLLII